MKIKKRIVVPTPSQIPKRYATIFKSKAKYSTNHLLVKRYTNIFVSHEGLTLKRFKLLPNSTFNIKGKDDYTFYYPFWKITLEQYLVSTFGKSLTKVNLDTGCYLLIYTKWFGYFFWLTDSLPKLIKTSSDHKKLKLIIPESWKSFNYVMESLAAFPDLEFEWIPSGVHMQVKSLILPETRKFSNAIDPEEIALCKAVLVSKAQQFCPRSFNNKKIYISRKLANRRKVVNEEALVSFLNNQGFSILNIEEFNFFEQVKIMSQALIVVGLHGAGLTNCLFMNEKTTLIELSPEVTNDKDLRISFWRLANANNLNYKVVFCKTKGNFSDIYDCDLQVNIDCLEKILNLNV